MTDLDSAGIVTLRRGLPRRMAEAGLFIVFFAASACDNPENAAKTGGTVQRTEITSDSATSLSSRRRPGKRVAVQSRPGGGKPLGGAGIVQMTGGVLDYELRPSYAGPYAGVRFHTNRWGMRDRDYELARPPGVYRIALLGSSYAMAAGVSEEKSFAKLLEKKLNDAAMLAGLNRSYEVLNFGVGGYSVLQNLVIAEQKVFRFNPNAVLVVLETTERNRLEAHLVKMVGKNIPVPYPELDSILRNVGTAPGMSEMDATMKIRLARRALLTWHFKHLAETLKKGGIPVLAVVLPRANAGGQDRTRMGNVAGFAEEPGFLMLTADDVFEGQPRDSLVLSANAQQLSPLAHRLIAERLERELRNEAGKLLGFPAGRTRVSRPSGTASQRR